MTPQQIADRLKEADALKAQLAEANGKVTDLSTKFETFSSDFETKVAEAVAKAIPQPKAQPQHQTPPEKADFLTDPDNAFAQRAAPLVTMTLTTAAYTARNLAREKFQRMQRSNPGKNYDGYFFEKFENEMENMAKTVPTAQLANPETWEHIYYNVKGRHADEILQQQKEGKLDLGIESGGAGARGTVEKPVDEKLTPLELKIAARLGQTAEEYLAQKKKIDSSSIGVNV